ncbi:hypothetical protein HOY82DRAFT_671581 [Tuber indicum]|nr:hypothetical protein HOY82DRAFT_671581 [Tuber indicum]
MLRAAFSSPKNRETLTFIAINGVSCWFAMGILKEKFYEAGYRKRDQELHKILATRNDIGAKHHTIASTAK